MIEQYASLCKKFTAMYGREAFDNFAHFVGMKGREYDKQKEFRLMLVGRSTNGWLSYSKGLKAEAFGARMEEVFKDKDHKAFDWIAPDFTNGDKYRISASKFWNYSGEVWKGLNEKLNNKPVDISLYQNRWFEFICWTNLYKINEQGLTPGIKMTRLQTPECMEILREEIETYKPTHILMEIDESWFTAFGPLFSSIRVLHEGAVKVTASYKGSKVLVTIRPEIVKKNEFVADVIRAFI